MKKEFIPYEQALALKKLGFDEPCLAHLIGFGDGTIENDKYFIKYQQVFYPHDNIKSDDKAEELELYSFGICGVPLYQQAFRWFREKYNVHMYPTKYDETKWWVNWATWTSKVFDTYEEAELECLKKLIEIVKNK